MTSWTDLYHRRHVGFLRQEKHRHHWVKHGCSIQESHKVSAETSHEPDKTLELMEYNTFCLYVLSLNLEEQIKHTPSYYSSDFMIKTETWSVYTTVERRRCYSKRSAVETSNQMWTTIRITAVKSCIYPNTGGLNMLELTMEACQSLHWFTLFWQSMCIGFFQVNSHWSHGALKVLDADQDADHVMGIFRIFWSRPSWFYWTFLSHRSALGYHFEPESSK